MALTDLTRISTSGIATGSTIDAPILRKDVSFHGTQVGVTSALFDSSDDALEFNDNVKLKFGNSENLQIYYDSSSYITNGTAGHLFIKTLNSGSDIRLESNENVPDKYKNTHIPILYGRLENAPTVASYINGNLTTCDIEKKNIQNAKKFTSNNSKFIDFIIDDSLNFLSSFKKKIDFLYLDSLDGQHKEASKHQLKEIEIAKEKLSEDSLVLLDDKGSKTNYSIDFMLNNDFKVINETKEQVLLSYK